MLVGTTHMNFIFTRIVARVARKANREVNLYDLTKFRLYLSFTIHHFNR